MATTNQGQDFMAQLQDAMAQSGLTRAEIARRTGLSYSVVHGAAAGTRDITLGTATRLCEALGLEVRLLRRKAKRKA